MAFTFHGFLYITVPDLQQHLVYLTSLVERGATSKEHSLQMREDIAGHLALAEQALSQTSGLLCVPPKLVRIILTI